MLYRRPFVLSYNLFLTKAMKFDFNALTVIVVSVAGSWTGLSVKYDRKLAVLSDKFETCACSKGEVDPTSDSALLSQVAEATKLSTQSLETSKRVERRLDADTGTKQSNEDSPFTKDGDGWWVAPPGAMFLFPAGISGGGIVIGQKNEDCNYGDAFLSVDGEGENCPSGYNSVTFGRGNLATGRHSSVTGGGWNTASGNYASITAGNYNTASGGYSSTTGGAYNTAKGDYSSISGGLGNNAEAKGEYSSITGGTSNTASGKCSSITGGKDNSNTASGYASSITGGHENKASGVYTSITGGSRNQAQGNMASVSGGFRNSSKGKYASVLGGKRKVSSQVFGIFPQ